MNAMTTTEVVAIYVTTPMHLTIAVVPQDSSFRLTTKLV